MKTLIFLIALGIYVQVTAQAIPDYSSTYFGLSKDIVKSESYTYEYDQLLNTYELDLIETMIFENGLLKEKLFDNKGSYSYKTSCYYSYNSAGKVIKEEEITNYPTSTSQTTITYIYTGAKLTQKNRVASYETTQTFYTYDTKGKPTKSETKNDKGVLVTTEDFSNVTDEKNYKKVTKFYNINDGIVTSSNIEVYVNGHYTSFISESKNYGTYYYDYTYDAYGNIVNASEDNIIFEKNNYEYDSKGNWIKCKAYLDDWLTGETDSYKFRKLTYKTGNAGSTAFDPNFLNKFPSSINKPATSITGSNANQSVPNGSTNAAVANTPKTTPKSASNPGCEGNCVDGYGRYYYSDGGIYDGFFKNSFRNGPGKFTFTDGATYVGNWVNGIKEGYAIYTWNDGSSYSGYYKNEKLNGEGIYIDKNKVVKGGIFKDGNFEQSFLLTDNGTVTGCFSGDCYNGFGGIRYINGNVFKGFFQNGSLKHGIFAFANKESFIGEFNNSKRSGFGLYTWNNQNYYFGMNQDDAFNGLGYYYVKADPSKILIGEFRKGSLYLKM